MYRFIQYQSVHVYIQPDEHGSLLLKGRTLQCTLYTSDKRDEFSQQDSVAVRGVSGGK